MPPTEQSLVPLLSSPPVWGALGVGYALGCFATGYYLVRCKTGRDVRETGSGGSGARNVDRLLGRSGFFLTVLGDGGKGAAAAGLALLWTGDERAAWLTLLACVLGHIWPAQLGLRGGKGVATAVGGLTICSGHLLLALLFLFFGGWAITRRTITGGMLSFALLPFAGWFLNLDGLALGVCAVMAALILFAHRQHLTEELAALAPGDVAPAATDSSSSKS